MLFNEEIKILQDDSFEGSVAEHCIFTQVFFGKTVKSSKKCQVMGGFNFESNYNNHEDFPFLPYGAAKRRKISDPKSTVTCRLVESSSEGVISNCYLLKQKTVTNKRNDDINHCRNDVKDEKDDDIHVSQQNYETALTLYNPNESQKYANKRWNRSTFIELDEDELAFPKDSSSDPRRLLRYLVSRFLRAMGWHIGKRKRTDKSNGIGEYIYRSPEGRPIREFSRVWSTCRQFLFGQTENVFQENGNGYWTDMSEFCNDLSNKVSEIEGFVDLGTTDSFADCFNLLDPFANLVFIRKKISSLKAGKLAKVKNEYGYNNVVNGPLLYLTNGHQPEQKYLVKKRHLEDDDLLISAIMKNNKSSNTKLRQKSKKTLRKQKSQKGSCRLLPRNLSNGGNICIERKRTVLSLLINSGVILVNEVIQYRNPKNDSVVKDGLITFDGILCRCCNKVFSVSEFKYHAGYRLNRPCSNLFMESGKPFTLCQLEAWSVEYRARKSATRTVQVDHEMNHDTDQNDNICGLCGDGGELICCDNCPSTFHQTCLYAQELPEGSWYCWDCTCRICGDLVKNEDPSVSTCAFKCSQCLHKYHETCLEEKNIKGVVGSSNAAAWFCSESCNKVYVGLRSRIGVMNEVSDGYSWTLLRCCDQKVQSAAAQRFVALRAECNLKLAVGLSIMEECFLPMVDPSTGIDMITHALYNRGSEFARLNYLGFHTVVLEKDDAIISIASLRIHGVKVAEMPLIATSTKYRRQGMCRRLLNAIEEMLRCYKVEKLVISAIPSLEETWKLGFGFKSVLESEKMRSVGDANFMVFPGTIWLKKDLTKPVTPLLCQ